MTWSDESTVCLLFAMVDHVMAYAISQAQEPYIRIDSTQGCVRHSVANLASCTMPVDMIGVPHMIGGLQRCKQICAIASCT